MTAHPITRVQIVWRFSVVSLTISLSAATTTATAQDSGRIKRKRPTAQETERVLSETVMNDGSLRKGDIVSTNRGFFVFEGIAADGVTLEFRPTPNPVRR